MIWIQFECPQRWLATKFVVWMAPFKGEIAFLRGTRTWNSESDSRDQKGFGFELAVWTLSFKVGKCAPVDQTSQGVKRIEQETRESSKRVKQESQVKQWESEGTSCGRTRSDRSSSYCRNRLMDNKVHQRSLRSIWSLNCELRNSNLCHQFTGESPSVTQTGVDWRWLSEFWKS